MSMCTLLGYINFHFVLDKKNICFSTFKYMVDLAWSWECELIRECSVNSYDFVCSPRGTSMCIGGPPISTEGHCSERLLRQEVPMYRQLGHQSAISS